MLGVIVTMLLVHQFSTPGLDFLGFTHECLSNLVLHDSLRELPHVQELPMHSGTKTEFIESYILTKPLLLLKNESIPGKKATTGTESRELYFN